MANPANPPPSPARPAVVTASSYLLYLVAVLQLIGVVIAFALMGRMREAYEQAFADVDAPGAAEIATASAMIGTLFGLVVGIALAVMGIFNSRGKNGSRIATWVVGGLYLCCAGFSLLSSAVGTAISSNTAGSSDAPDPSEIQARLEELLPSWYQPVNLTTSVIAVLALFIALILLALPAANDYFRRPQQVWEPPLPGSSYPTAPGSTYPTYPPTTPPSAGPQTPPSGPQTPPAGGQQPPQPPAS